MKASLILEMLSQSFISMNEKSIFIKLFIASIVILLLPLKNISALGKFNVLLKFFKDFFLFIGISMIICFILVKFFLESFVSDKIPDLDFDNLEISNLFDFNLNCARRTTFFKWFFSFWKGYSKDCDDSKLYNLDKALQNVMWILLILKIIHTIETVILPFVNGYISKKMFPLIQILSYIFYIGLFGYYILKSETDYDDEVKNINKIMYNSAIIYTMITFFILIIDKVLIYLSKYISMSTIPIRNKYISAGTYMISDRNSDRNTLIGTNPISHKYAKNHLPVKLINNSMVPNMKYIISLNLFVIIGVFFKKFYEFKTN